MTQKSSYFLFKQFYCLMQPKKKSILNLLEKVGSPLNTNQIAEILKFDHKITSSHLLELAELRLITSVLKQNKKGRPSKFYQLAKTRDGSIKVKKVRQKIIKVLNQ